MIKGMQQKALITSVSNKFFPSLLNLIGSIKKNYPHHPTIFVYDLGLIPNFRAEIEAIESVKILPMPHFCHHWRSCYTWKTYILSHPLAENNLYIDAGSQVMRPLDDIFEMISKNGYFIVGQGLNLGRVAPQDYFEILGLDESYKNKEVITAGIFGFVNNGLLDKATKTLYILGKAGLCLGFSPREKFRNFGHDKTEMVRDCDTFRHDTTLLSLLVYKFLAEPKISPCDIFGFAGQGGPPEAYILNFRRNFFTLGYIAVDLLHKRPRIIFLLNRIYIDLFLFAKRLNLAVKNILGFKGVYK